MDYVITENSELSAKILRVLNDAIVDANDILEEYRPIFNGERYLTDKELSARIKVSRRTLHDWRKFGYISYIQLEGKVLYKESDVEQYMQKIHSKAWADM